MAETNKLLGYAKVIGVLAIITLIVLVLVSGISKTTRDRTNAEVNVTLGLTNRSAAVGTTGQYPFLQSITGGSCLNTSGSSFNASQYAVIEGNKDGGQLYLNYGTAGANDYWQSQVVDCSIVYLKASAASDTGDQFMTGIQYFGIFAGVLVIAGIGLVVIRMFSGKKRDL